MTYHWTRWFLKVWKPPPHPPTKNHVKYNSRKISLLPYAFVIEIGGCTRIINKRYFSHFNMDGHRFLNGPLVLPSPKNTTAAVNGPQSLYTRSLIVLEKFEQYAAIVFIDSEVSGNNYAVRFETFRRCLEITPKFQNISSTILYRFLGDN